MHFLPILLTALIAAEPNHIAANVALKEAEFDSLDEALHILRMTGTVELSAPRRKGTIEIEVFKDGKKQSTLHGGGIEATESSHMRFTVQVIDMDYLTLGDGKKGHCRLYSKVAVGSSFGSTAQDVSKDIVDFSKMTSGGAFTADANTEDLVPLFWKIGKTQKVSSGSTPADVVRLNPRGDLAIVYLRLSK